jgi:predicted MPP superfamily phosphohydrolase
MGNGLEKERSWVKLRLGEMVVLFWLVLSGVCFGQDRNFYFVQITDTHLGIPGNKIRTEQVVAAVNLLPMEILCVVHTGDIIDRSKQLDAGVLTDAASIFKNLKPRVHFLPGNNDILLEASTQTSRTAYENAFGSLTSRAEYQGVVFIFAYTDPLRESVDMAGYDPFGAVKNQLDAADGKPVILFHHGPSVDDFYNNRFHGGWAKKTKDNWVALINQYNVKAVITGHFHRDEFHWLGEVPLYVSPPVAEKWGRQACFRIYEYRQNGRIEYTTQYLE